MKDERFAVVHAAARQAATIVHQANRDFTDLDDLTQEGMLWLLSHKDRIQHHTLPDGEVWFTRLVGELVTELAKVARRERREFLGHDPEVEYMYSTRLVEAVLPAVFDPDHKPPRRQLDDPASKGGDPSEGNNWAVFVLDVKRAVDAVCDRTDKQALFARSVGGWTWAKHSQVLGRSDTWWRLRYRDAVSRIVEFLNDGVVRESSVDAERVVEAFEGAGPAARVDARHDWDTAGKDPYREPEL